MKTDNPIKTLDINRARYFTELYQIKRTVKGFPVDEDTVKLIELIDKKIEEVATWLPMQQAG
jgi:hypothetical protein